MLIPEKGVHQTSERYFFTPSSLARELFYYPTRCGHYFCSSEYSFSPKSPVRVTITRILCCFCSSPAPWSWN